MRLLYGREALGRFRRLELRIGRGQRPVGFRQTRVGADQLVGGGLGFGAIETRAAEPGHELLRVHARGTFERIEHVAFGDDQVVAFVHVKVSDGLAADDAKGRQPAIVEARLFRHRRALVAGEPAAERFAEIGHARGIFRAPAGERRRALDGPLDEIDAIFEQRRLGLAQRVRLGPRRRLSLDEPPHPGKAGFRRGPERHHRPRRRRAAKSR